MIRVTCLTCVLLGLVLVARAAPSAALRWVDADRGGRIWGLLHDGALLPVEGYFQVAAPEWRPHAGPQDLRKLRRRESDATRHWSGRFSLAGTPFRWSQTLREAGDEVELEMRVEAESEAQLEGIFYRFRVPAAVFGGGRCRFVTPEDASEADLPEPGSRSRVGAGPVEQLIFRDAEDNMALRISFDTERRVTVNARPGWLAAHYDVLIRVRRGALQPGREVPFRCRLAASGKADHSPARLRLEASSERYRLVGFGGNYCFWPMGPDTPHTLKHLSPAWARSQLSLDAWEKRNDNADPERINWEAFKGKHGRRWLLRTDLRAATQASAHGVPLVVSVWRVPEWMLEEGEEDSRKKPIDPDSGSELAESVVAYLQYLRREHDVEPELFSFNEPDLGKIPEPGDYRDVVKVIGRRLRDAGLKTRILAGDTGNPRGDKVDYARPLLEDPGAREYVGALSFHSWGGAEPETYRAWADLARSHDLPLFVAEIGWNALAHKGGHSMHTLRYALEELRIYQDLLRYAEPQVLLEWEYGGSYPLLLQEGDDLRPTLRYHLMKHYAALTPQPGLALGAESDSPDVLVTAFRGAAGPAESAFAVHVANLGAGRPAVLEGVPPDVREVRATQTTPADGYRSLGTVPVHNGTVRLKLAPLSLLTLCW